MKTQYVHQNNDKADILFIISIQDHSIASTE